jgi:hypothetical protein
LTKKKGSAQGVGGGARSFEFQYWKKVEPQILIKHKWEGLLRQLWRKRIFGAFFVEGWQLFGRIEACMTGLTAFWKDFEAFCEEIAAVKKKLGVFC